jgi:tryptophan-rich sensory protein
MTTPFPRRAALVGAVLILAAGSAIGLITQTGEGSWYQSLIRPAATPPGWAFGVIWPLLYILIGAAGGIVWSARQHPARGRALFWFALQLALNFAWTPVFFGQEQIALGLGVILALNVAAIVATVRMARVSPLAARLMLPYLVWIAYAAVLNFRIWQLNPALPTFA